MLPMTQVRFGLLVLLLVLLAGSAAGATPTRVYLPLLRSADAAALAYQVNSPYYSDDNLDDRFGELAIFWFGQVDATRNYADVRIAHNDRELYVYVAVFDRRLWYTETPSRDTLTDWDAVTLYLDDGTQRHRFVAQLSGGGSADYQAAYRAGTAGWLPATTSFTTRPGWRGDRLNDATDDRGWVMTFRIPFSSVGLSARPKDGTNWRIGMALHDRDDAAGTPIADQFWPPAFDSLNPTTWGGLRFGLPAYTSPATATTQTYRIRHGENGVSAPDAAVGGGAICGDGLDFWAEWGASSRDAGRGDFNVQNQSDIADWPCFSKYYVTFPLDSLPRGQTIVAAELVLHQFGNAQPADATPSLIQIHTVDQPWNERDLTWNNAPLAMENVGAGWVDPLVSSVDWPGIARRFDLSRAVAEAYAAGKPLRLAVYSADSDYHSGKYFVSSDTGDWNAAGRPTLLITLGR
jgi:hypothetical protein